MTVRGALPDVGRRGDGVQAVPDLHDAPAVEVDVVEVAVGPDLQVDRTGAFAAKAAVVAGSGSPFPPGNMIHTHRRE